MVSGITFDKSNKGIAAKKIRDILDKRTTNRRPTEPALKTTAEATKAAAALGYRRTYDYKFDSHGQAVYKKENQYITWDVDAHSGGVWKIFDAEGERKGTADKNLNIIKK